MILETERLILRELTDDDAEAVWHLNADPRVTRFLGEPTLTSAEHALTILRTYILPQYRDHGVGRLAVTLRDGGELVGWCGLKYLVAAGEYDLGYRFAPRHWGRGYATESAAAVLRWAAAALPEARIVGRVHVDNHASIRVLEKLGLRLEGHEEEPDAGTTAVYVRAR